MNSSLFARGVSRLPFYYGWVLIGIAFITIAIGISARTSFSLLLPPLIDEFHWSRGLASGSFAFGFLVSALISPIVGQVMDRYGPRFLLLAGACLTALGLLLATMMQEPWQLYATLGFLVGGGQTSWGLVFTRPLCLTGLYVAAAWPWALRFQVLGLVHW